VTRELHPLNIDAIAVTALVTKFVNVSEVSDEQLRNIEVIFVTLAVLKEEILSDDRELQFPNTPHISVTALVTKFVNASEVSDEHP
jgi:hypothetical protein